MGGDNLKEDAVQAAVTHLKPKTQPPPGERIKLTDGQLFIPEGFKPAGDRVPLTLHLHGAYWAAEKNQREIAELLIAAGADLELQTSWGATAEGSPYPSAGTCSLNMLHDRGDLDGKQIAAMDTDCRVRLKNDPEVAACQTVCCNI